MIKSDVLGEINLGLCLRSGQAFHWEDLDGSYVIVSGDRAWQVVPEGEDWRVYGSSEEDLCHYLDLGRDYNKINIQLKEDLTLALFVEAARGLRILNQVIWDAVVAFIISTNNNVKRIQGSVFKLSELYGEKIGSFEGKDYYSLPSPEVLAQVSPEELRAKCGVGYRDRYLVESARLVASGHLDLDGIKDQEAEIIREELIKLPGVGRKAADCILLFGYGCRSSFPVDVWMERTMQTLYGPFNSREEISDFGMEKFGDQAGYVQQLLFHYSRTHKGDLDLAGR